MARSKLNLALFVLSSVLSLALGLTVSTALGQAGPPGGGGGGGGTMFDLEVTHVIGTQCKATYTIPSNPEYEYVILVCQFEGHVFHKAYLEATPGTHAGYFNVTQDPMQFDVQLECKEKYTGFIGGETRLCRFEDETLTEIMAGTFVGATGVAAVDPPAKCEICPTDDIGGVSTLTSPYSSLTQLVAKDYVNSDLQSTTSSCSACLSAQVREYHLPEARLIRTLSPNNTFMYSGFGPAFYSNWDTKIYLYEDHQTNEVLIRLLDAELSRTVTLFDGDDGIIDGIFRDKDQRAFKKLELKDAGGNLATTIEDASEAILYRYSGTEYKFEIQDFNPDPELDKKGRLTEIMDRHGNSISVTYKYATPPQPFPAKWWQLDKVTDAYGKQLSFSYHGSTVSGRWVISSVGLPNGKTVSYNYGDFLTGVTHANGESAQFVYQLDPVAQTAIIDFFDPMAADPEDRRLKVHVTQDVIELENGIMNQPTGVLRMIVDGCDNHRLSIYPKGFGALDSYVWLGTDTLIDYSPGQRYQYFTSWTVYDPSWGWQAFTGIKETTFAVQNYSGPTSSPGLGNPGFVKDITGRQYDYEYDDDTFPIKKTYSDGTYEQWEYDDYKNVTRYRDREERVTKFVYDSVGNLTEMHVGILQVNGSDVDQPEKAVYKWDYNAKGQVTVAYGPKWNGQPDIYRTEYAYNAENRLQSVTDSADETGGPRPVTTFAYDTHGRVSSITDPMGRVTSFLYDDANRTTQITHNDSSTEQFLYGAGGSYHEGLILKYKNRRDIVTKFTHGFCSHLQQVIQGYSTNSNVLGGGSGTVHSDTSYQHITTLAYEPGTQNVVTEVYDGEKTTHTYDYRDRVVTKTKYPNASESLVTEYEFVNNELNRVKNPYGIHTHFGYRSSDGLLARVIQAADKDWTAPSQQLIMSTVRSAAPNADYIILDSIRNGNGEETELIDARGISHKSGYDSRGRRTWKTEADGTAIEARSEFDYDISSNVTEIRRPRYFAAGDPAANLARGTASYTARDLLKQLNVAPGTSDAASKAFTYLLDRRPDATVDFRGNTWKNDFHNCCGRLLGARDPLGHGAIQNNDYQGNVTHIASVSNYDSHLANTHDPVDATTLQEITSFYDALDRRAARTQWTSPRGLVDEQSPPIAGFNGEPGGNGFTFRVYFDHNLTDGAGLDSSGGLSVPKLSGGSFPVSIASCLQKLAEPTTSGGAGISLGTNGDGTALVYINEEEEIAVQILDGANRLVMVAAIESHDGNSPNALINWMCIKAVGNVSGASFDNLIETQLVDPDANVTRYRNDGAGRSLEYLDADGHVSTREFDNNSNAISIRDPNDVGEDNVFDELGRLTQSTDTENDVRKFRYDRAGNLVESEDSNTEITTYVYDIRDRLIESTDRVSAVTKRTYDGGSNLLSVEDGENRITSYSYDPRNLLTSRTYSDHVAGSGPGSSGYGIVSTDYDDLGRTSRTTQQTGETQTFNYDFAGRLVSKDNRTAVNSPSGTVSDSETFAYDAVSRILSAVSQRYSNTVTLAYDGMGRVSSESLLYGGKTYTTTTDYNSRGLVSKKTYPGGSFAERTYTSRNQLHETRWNGSVVDTRTYDNGGRLTQIVHGNNLTTSLAWRLDDLVSEIDSPSVNKLNYTYDANKNITGETITGALSGFGFSTGSSGYDKEDRLVNWNRNDDNQDQSWVLSKVGDWNSFTEEGVSTSRTYSDAHEVETVGTANLDYDLKGNLTTNVNGHQLSWDIDSRLAGVDTDGNGTDDITYTYDAFGRRVSKDAGTNHTIYVSSGAQVVGEYDHGANASNPNEEFIYGSYVDEPIAKTGSGGTLYYHRNQQFSVTGLSNSAGTVVERYAYDSHGRVTVFDGSGVAVPGNESQLANHYLYTGRRWDRDSELYYFRARYFSPELGRFISRDPAGFVDGHNLYQGYFVPNGLDPSGLFNDDITHGWIPEGRVRTPGAARGKWIKGTRGNGTFEYTDTPLNRSRKLVGVKVKFVEGYIAEQAFPEKYYWKGNYQSATVDISDVGARVNGDNSDFSAADRIMRERHGADWKRPKGYTWNHAGKPGSTVLELVKTEVHEAVAHKGPAAGPRKAARDAKKCKLGPKPGVARCIAGLNIYMTFRDAAMAAGANSLQPLEHAPYYFTEGENIFIIKKPVLTAIYSSYKEYIAGPKAGTKEYITNKKRLEYKKKAEAVWGKYIPGHLFRSPRFIPGTRRKSIPIINGCGEEEGYIDEDGPHYVTPFHHHA